MKEINSSKMLLTINLWAPKSETSKSEKKKLWSPQNPQIWTPKAVMKPSNHKIAMKPEKSDETSKPQNSEIKAETKLKKTITWYFDRFYCFMGSLILLGAWSRSSSFLFWAVVILLLMINKLYHYSSSFLFRIPIA